MNYNIKDGILLEYTGNEEEVTIPEQVHTIASYAFENCEQLKKINLNRTKRIDEGAFCDCISLESIEFESVESISKYAFYNCFSLKEVELKSVISFIDEQAFAYCVGLKKVEIHMSNLSKHLFYHCKNLEEIQLGKEVESIDLTSFLGCTNIQTIQIDPENEIYDDRGNAIVESKENRLFLGCKNTTIEASIHSIGYHSFQNIKKVKMLEGVQIIEPEAFYQCSQLEEIELAQSISYIGAAAFYQCESLKRIVIPRSIQSLESHTFHGCVTLEELVLEGNTKISPFLFDSFGNDFCILPKNLKIYMKEEAKELPSKFIPFLINGYLEEERYFIKDHRQVVEKYIHTHIQEIKEDILLNCKNPALKEMLVDSFMEYYRTSRQFDRLAKLLNSNHDEFDLNL
ncbi:MAG: leucine-rich repeat domain-containing protein [Firmicutes bacterium]|nr:leucine-rich repeat domain-containing protein [Bacillota bacterium]